MLLRDLAKKNPSYIHTYLLVLILLEHLKKFLLESSTVEHIFDIENGKKKHFAWFEYVRASF